MKKLLFAIAICGFVFTSCGNKTKAAASEEKACCPNAKTEVVAEKAEGCKTDCSKTCTAEAKAECTKDSTAVVTEAKAECSKDCTKDCCKK
jgi:hypothetical protein